MDQMLTQKIIFAAIDTHKNFEWGHYQNMYIFLVFTNVVDTKTYKLNQKEEWAYSTDKKALGKHFARSSRLNE